MQGSRGRDFTEAFKKLVFLERMPQAILGIIMMILILRQGLVLWYWLEQKVSISMKIIQELLSNFKILQEIKIIKN